VPQDSDETVVDEDADAAARMGEDMLKEDIAEQRELIAKLKAQKDNIMDDVSGAKSKRDREEVEQEYPTKLNIQEPEVGERAIATNTRVNKYRLVPGRKSFAWGVAAAAVGFGAACVLFPFRFTFGSSCSTPGRCGQICLTWLI
jgi:hypothetical protein